ncbi:MAG: hypothetical protein QOG62_770 [Thermoleophilaceae bacterium]|nr:hypothetical protein [Thermoleophilaceae bacterium]
MAAVDVVDGYVAKLPGDARRLAHAEWGLTVPAEAAGGWPLDVGLRISDELLRAQAFIAPHDPAQDAWTLLHWNRQTRLIRFACTRSGDIWAHGDVPVAAVTDELVDRLLGLLVEAALAVRRP